jgi:hypothetical protein
MQSKQRLRLGAACTLCIAASRSPCRRYQGRAICPFGGAGDTLQPHRHLSMTLPRLHQLSRRSRALARRQCAALLARPRNVSAISYQANAQRQGNVVDRLPVASSPCARAPPPGHTLPTAPTLIKQSQTKPNQTKPTKPKPNHAKPHDQRRVPFSISRLNRVEMWRCIHFSKSQKPPRPPARVRSNQTVYQATHQLSLASRRLLTRAVACISFDINSERLIASPRVGAGLPISLRMRFYFYFFSIFLISNEIRYPQIPGADHLESAVQTLPIVLVHSHHLQCLSNPNHIALSVTGDNIDQNKLVT